MTSHPSSRRLPWWRSASTRTLWLPSAATTGAVCLRCKCWTELQFCEKIARYRFLLILLFYHTYMFSDHKKVTWVNTKINNDFIYSGKKPFQTNMALCEKVIVLLLLNHELMPHFLENWAQFYSLHTGLARPAESRNHSNWTCLTTWSWWKDLKKQDIDRSKET